MQSIIVLISKKCKNAEVGYTNKEEENIKNNMKELPNDKIEKEKSFEYKCPDCGNTLDKDSKFCKNCGCKIDWE